MSVAYFLKDSGRNLDLTGGKEALVASLDNLVGDYVIFAKCVIAPQSGPTEAPRIVSVMFRLVFGEQSDAAWASLDIVPGRLPIITVALSIASPPTPPSMTVAPGFTPITSAELEKPALPSSGKKGVSAQLLCSCSALNPLVEINHICITAIKVDAINPP